jgi:hypothetical protein
MTLIFPSRELDRQITLPQVWEMDLDDARQFHVELTLSVQSLDDAIREAQRLENDAGIPFDRNWMHKARKKRRITIMFASETKRRLLRLEGLEGADVRRKRSAYEMQRDKFLIIRNDRLRELLKEEMGPGVLEEIECEAHEEAEELFKAWLEKEGHQPVYVT